MALAVEAALRQFRSGAPAPPSLLEHRLREGLRLASPGRPDQPRAAPAPFEIRESLVRWIALTRHASGARGLRPRTDNRRGRWVSRGIADRARQPGA